MIFKRNVTEDIKCQGKMNTVMFSVHVADEHKYFIKKTLSKHWFQGFKTINKYVCL